MSKKIHFIGIGGIGMSALARYYKNKGFDISGSDSEDSDLIGELKNEGISVVIGHREENLFQKDLDSGSSPEGQFTSPEGQLKSLDGGVSRVFYSKAIAEDNLELQKARNLGITCLSYFEGLGEISKNTKCIAVAGSHGKSTTTSMIGVAMQELGMKPNVIVGTQVPNFGNMNFLAGDGDYLVVEACEYRDSFLSLNVFGAVITNIEADHLDYYKNEENYIKSFRKFVSKISQDGFLVLDKDDANSQKIKTLANCKVIEVSRDDEDFKLIPEFNTPGEHIRLDGFMALKVVEMLWFNFQNGTNEQGMQEQESGKAPGQQYGNQVARDRLATYDLENGNSEQLKIAQNKIIEALKSFRGTWRRFEYLGKFQGVDVISDYAHHPTEIHATLKGAIEKFKDKKIICIFEPHQYARTIEFFDGFCKSFKDCHLAIIPSIYKVRDNEDDIAKMSPEILADGINNFSQNAISVQGEVGLLDWLNVNLKGDEVLIFMGAGPVDCFARSMINNH